MIYKITIVHANRNVEDLVVYSHPSWPVVLSATGDPVPGWMVVYTIEEGANEDADMKPIVFKATPFEDCWVQLPMLVEERAAGRTFVLDVSKFDNVGLLGAKI